MGNPKLPASLMLPAFLAALLPTGTFADCKVQSGSQTAALVELFTSEGCSSCPPADRKLSQLPKPDASGSALTVPLALHVPYWDYLGWKDRFAQQAFAQRQYWLARSINSSTVYTPQIFVSGQEAGSFGLERRIDKAANQPAQARIRIQTKAEGARKLTISAQADATANANPVLYVAIAENGLVSNVGAGENHGRTLHHDHVVRLWIGPIEMRNGRASFSRTVNLPSEWQRNQLELAAFVENVDDGRILQAIGAAQCV